MSTTQEITKNHERSKLSSTLLAEATVSASDPTSVCEARALSTVDQYFAQFNQGHYETIADLFAADGQMLPPFEAPVVGREAIASYLAQEADGMIVENPTITALETTESGGSHLEVRGHVTMLVFKVRVRWQFKLSPQHQIDQVSIELLASLEELLAIRPG
ncbi:MAG: ketosteroid isomerase family protein [Leptolyngbyaceae cyanobacterium]